LLLGQNKFTMSTPAKYLLFLSRRYSYVQGIISLCLLLYIYIYIYIYIYTHIYVYIYVYINIYTYIMIYIYIYHSNKRMNNNKYNIIMYTRT